MARILVANDNVDLLDCCRAILEADGHVVEAVADGQKTLWLARSWQPDLIVIDWVMPEMDGPTAIAIGPVWRACSMSSIGWLKPSRCRNIGST